MHQTSVFHHNDRNTGSPKSQLHRALLWGFFEFFSLVIQPKENRPVQTKNRKTPMTTRVFLCGKSTLETLTPN